MKNLLRVAKVERLQQFFKVLQLIRLKQVHNKNIVADFVELRVILPLGALGITHTKSDLTVVWLLGCALYVPAPNTTKTSAQAKMVR